MTKQQKRMFLLNVPYVLMGLFGTNLGEAWRIAEGANFSEKFDEIFQSLPIALSNFLPSLHPFDCRYCYWCCDEGCCNNEG